MISARFAGRFGDFALDVAVEIPNHGVTGLVGPSGCGKSSLLRCLAGLVRLPGGALRVGNEIWQEGAAFLPPQQRPVGLVFQDARLFAHLNVRQNLCFGLRRVKPAERHIAEEDVIGFLGLQALLARAPAALSGGERQRVAIGRALLAQPRLLLLDEPLAALDRAAAAGILPKLREISERFAVPVVYVSHDMAELERVADFLLLMQAGRIIARGSLPEMLTDLALPFAAQRDAAVVLALQAGAHDADYDLTICTAADLQLVVPGYFGPAGTVVRLRVCASDVSLALEQPQGSSVLNALLAKILAVDAGQGAHLSLVLGVGAGEKLLCRITRKSWDRMGLRMGAEVYAQVKAVALADSQ